MLSYNLKFLTVCVVYRNTYLRDVGDETHGTSEGTVWKL